MSSLETKEQNDRLAALAAVLSHPQQATALLKTRCATAGPGSHVLPYATVLGLLGDPAAGPAWPRSTAAKAGTIGSALTSQRKTGNLYSSLDRLVIAWG